MEQDTLGFEPLLKKTRKAVFLEEMERAVPWATLVGLTQPYAHGAHQALRGRPPFAVETMLRIHCLQLWWNLSDPAMEEELHDRSLYLEFVSLAGAARLPDETTILRFRRLLEKHDLAPQVLATINAALAQQGLLLKTGTLVDATLIAAPSSIKNKSGERDPEMHQAKKGNQWHFGMNAHILAGLPAEQRETLLAQLDCGHGPALRDSVDGAVAEVRCRGFCMVPYADGEQAAIVAPAHIQRGALHAIGVGYRVPYGTSVHEVPAAILDALHDLAGHASRLEL